MPVAAITMTFSAKNWAIPFKTDKLAQILVR